MTPEEIAEDLMNTAMRKGAEKPTAKIYEFEPRPASSGVEILNSTKSFLSRFVIYPSVHAKVAHTLWVAHTHLMDVWDSTPRLAFLSPEPGSGKTRALEVTELLVPLPVEAVNVSPAYLFRKIGNEEGRATILYDEIDTVFGPKAKENEEIRGLLNAGHRRGAVAGRCVVRGNNIETEEISAFSAVALAGLGWLPDTILSRAITIRMRKRKPGEGVQAFRRRVEEAAGHALRDRLASWAAVVAPTLTDIWPEMPPGIEDRNADVWESLLAIADAAGGDWPKMARAAAVALVASAQEREPSLGIRLLADLRTVFGDRPAMPTVSIIAALCALEESPWNDLKGKPLTDRNLGHRLRQYEIKSKNVRVGSIVKGYVRDDLHDAWERYLPPLPSPDRSATFATSATTGENSNLFNDEDVANAETAGATQPHTRTSWRAGSKVAGVAGDVADTPSKNASKYSEVVDVADVAELAGDERGRVCAQCGADAPTVMVKNGAGEVWVHPECRKFWLMDHSL